MTKGNRIIIAAGVILLSGFIPAAFVSAQRPVAHWFKSPEGIGIIRVGNFSEQPPVVLFTDRDETTAYDTIFFHRIVEPGPEIMSWTDFVNHQSDLINKDSTSVGKVNRINYEEYIGYEREVRARNRTGSWEMESRSVTRPLDWLEGTTDYHAGEMAANGTGRLKPELTLRALSYKKGWVKVVLDEDTGATAFVRTSGETNAGPMFISWDKYLKNVSGVTFYEPEQKVYKKPRNISRHKIMDVRRTRVIEVRGEWVLLRKQEWMQPTEVIGWVKWHDGEKILIRVTQFLWH